MSYTLRSECQDQPSCALNNMELSSLGAASCSPTPRNQFSLPGGGDLGYDPRLMLTVGQGNISVDSAYFTSPEGTTNSPAPPPSPLSPHAVCPTKTRSSTWISSLRQLLQTPQQNSTAIGDQSSPFPAMSTISPPESLVGCTATVPESEEELDRFLFEVWTKDTVANPRSTASPVSHYVRKVSELRLFYEQKMTEVAQREATYLSELMYYNDTMPLPPSEQLSMADSLQLKQVLLEAKVNYRFNQIRYKLKKETAETVSKLRAQYIAESSYGKKKGLPHKTTKLLNQWFEEHLDHPYPTEEEKKQLSSRGEITMEQVSRWFANKRSRTKAMRGIPPTRGR